MTRASRSQPPLSTIPVEGFRDALAQRGRRIKSQILCDPLSRADPTGRTDFPGFVTAQNAGATGKACQYLLQSAERIEDPAWKSHPPWALAHPSHYCSQQFFGGAGLDGRDMVYFSEGFWLAEAGDHRCGDIRCECQAEGLLRVAEKRHQAHFDGLENL